MNRLIPHMIRMSLINARYTHTLTYVCNKYIEMMIYEYLSGTSKLYMKIGFEYQCSVTRQIARQPYIHIY